jgi:excisionase family DNA binding protein
MTNLFRFPTPTGWDVGPASGLRVAATPPAPGLLDPATAERLLTTKEAAALLGLSHRTLEGLRRRGGGPLFVALSRNAIRYRRSDLDAWIASRAAPHTAKARALLRAA